MTHSGHDTRRIGARISRGLQNTPTDSLVVTLIHVV